jgi:hypothetical protein
MASPFRYHSMRPGRLPVCGKLPGEVKTPIKALDVVALANKVSSRGQRWGGALLRVKHKYQHISRGPPVPARAAEVMRRQHQKCPRRASNLCGYLHLYTTHVRCHKWPLAPGATH